MKVLYSGHYKVGCTSRMRGEQLKTILQPDAFFVADSDIPVDSTPMVFRSLGWRTYRGPLIGSISDALEKTLSEVDMLDLAWIDKGVFIKKSTLEKVRAKSRKLIHYTPDCAFYFNRSRHFLDGISQYDHCVTTKSFELEMYTSHGAKDVVFCTQGYDPNLHFPRHSHSNKEGIIFIGLCEPYREDLLAYLIANGIHVKVAGENWERFARVHAKNPFLVYLGKGLFGQDYASAISGSLIGLGLLSRKFPELHTTRTFEIPACGTLLATERNPEIGGFFTEEEVLYYTGREDLLSKLHKYLRSPEIIREVSNRGSEKIRSLRFDYGHIMTGILEHAGFI